MAVTLQYPVAMYREAKKIYYKECKAQDIVGREAIYYIANRMNIHATIVGHLLKTRLYSK
jgi:hypothetical protein